MRVGDQRGGGENTTKRGGRWTVEPSVGRRFIFNARAFACDAHHCCTLSGGHGIVRYSGPNWWPVALATPRGATKDKVKNK